MLNNRYMSSCEMRDVTMESSFCQQLEVYQERKMDQHSSTSPLTHNTFTTFTPLTHTLTADPREHAQFPAVEWTYPHTSVEVSPSDP